MNEPDDTSEGRVPGTFDGAAHAHVAHLLAAAAPTTLPKTVADRLDRTLAELAAERAATDPGAGTARRPRALAARPGGGRGWPRRWPQLLVAAAAVSVLGLGLGNLAGDLTGGQAEQATSADDAARGADAGLGAPQEGRQGASAAGSAEALRSDGSGPRLRTGSLALDLQRIEDFGVAVPVASSATRWARACVQPQTGPRDEWTPARLDGSPAVVVLRAAEGGRRTADVFTCDDARTPAASTTVRAR